MSRREIIPPTLNEHDEEGHPAWGLIGASRVSSSPPGAVLFDSDMQHQHYVVVRVSAAKRKRTLNRDWLRGGKEYIEVAMSEAQWASFVSSMNAGDGVPCTVTRQNYKEVPGFPHEPRLGESVREVREAADKAVQEVQAAFSAYQEKKNAGNLRNLEYAIKNMPANITFAAKSLTEHAENVVQRSRADIEAMVIAQAAQMGLKPGDLGITLELEQGED